MVLCRRKIIYTLFSHVIIDKSNLQISFNIQWHYALDITEKSDEAKYINEKTLKTVSADLFDLVEQFKDQPAVCSMHSYKQMQRVLSEQCELADDGFGKSTVKKPRDIPSSSLQNPSDPEAT